MTEAHTFVDLFAAKYPPIYLPFEPAVINPCAEAVERATIAWADRVGLCGDDAHRNRKYALTGTMMCALYFPEAPEDRLQSMSNYSAWGFLFDDVTEKCPIGQRTRDLSHLVARLIRVAQAPSSALLGDDALETCLADAIRELRRCFDPTQMRWFVDSFRTWMVGFLWETSVRERGAPLTLNDYLIQRYGCAGAENAVVMATMVVTDHGDDLPASEVSSPVVCAATEALLMTGALDNERYSYAMATLEQNHQTNLFEMIRSQNPGMSFDDAVVEAIALRDRIMSLYVRLREQIWPRASHWLRRYLRGIEHLVNGNVTFGQKCVRYINPHTTSPTRSVTPSDPSTEPLPLPSIAWWWDHLA
jgi:hypothetical protein